MWLATSADQRVSLWRSSASFDLCHVTDWLLDCDGRSTHHASFARFIDRNLVLFTDYETNRCLQIYNFETREFTRQIALNQWCASFGISETHRFLAMGTNDRLVQIRDYTQGTFQDFLGHSASVSNVTFSEPNDVLITTAFNELFLWNICLN